ncbi:bifunctional diguanylate cyclase/phosphodiesterase [Methylobacterium sp. NEAU 140]|uniref:putative bifunctional diguanylate cyclase/phosphodiesterase n=1 Tax=Methylobacterium sp. NEAU 140 TaxID=3064945 RepID=UPI002734166F|nr:bifunctional diguanylate cyclase/phosphodiesterase [Methylobacterium sp. NEAU 140]MDP4026028.1 bifunctional diguanylate cyclase/phosphodiesterase [Methylobacterium sp. NEAU 140]
MTHQDGAGSAEIDGPELARLTRRDQLAAVRRSVLIALPVNALLGLTGLAVAAHSGLGRAGAAWFAASLSANVLRAALCRAPCPGLALAVGAPPETAAAAAAAVDRHLRLSWLAALLSGLVWACLPILCAGYTAPQTLFYLTVTCGITAGAVTHGTAFARIPLAFIAPPLLSAVGCLALAGGFDRLCLAATVLLYLAALARAAFESEAAFREASRLKNEATALARSREAARASASALAEAMAHRAAHDGLTGLLNRAGFLYRAQARPGAACLMLLDLDGFKAVNDLYGHGAGDRVLAEVARRLREAVPALCLVARLGGDEFAVLYDPAAGPPPADLAAALIAAIARPFESFGAGRLGVSIGVQEGAEASLTERLSRADEALYAAKAAGRNRFHLFDEDLRGRLDMRRDSERDLSQALAEGAPEVWFQPIRGPDGRTLAGLEALVRWHHPRHGWVPPNEIVAAAATMGLAESLLRLVLERSCAMMLDLRARGHGAVRVAMNVSPREMAQVPVDEIVLDRLRALGLPAAAFEIEITEETALDIAAVGDRLAALSGAGVRVALDDFGAGYSSLSSLRQFRTSRIKIDRALVTGLGGSDDKRGMVQAVLGLGRSLGLEVVAEGVETAEDLAALQALGCPFLQGYHLGRPMPADAILAALPASAPRAA